jgi:hypothetical protein
MPARRVMSLTVPVDGRSAVAVESYPARSPLLTIVAARPAMLVTLTLPEDIDLGHVRFAHDLAVMARQYAIEVERRWRSLQSLPATSGASA